MNKGLRPFGTTQFVVASQTFHYGAETLSKATAPAKITQDSPDIQVSRVASSPESRILFLARPEIDNEITDEMIDRILGKKNIPSIQ